MAEGRSISQLSIEDFAEYLLDRGFNATVAKSFEENQISGAAFLNLSNDDLKELVPLIGVRLGIRELLQSARQVCASA